MSNHVALFYNEPSTFGKSKMMDSQKVPKGRSTSSRRKPGSSNFNNLKTPAYAGVTVSRTFYEPIKIERFHTVGGIAP